MHSELVHVHIIQILDSTYFFNIKYETRSNFQKIMHICLQITMSFMNVKQKVTMQ